MLRFFDDKKKPLKSGQEGPFSLACMDDTNDWNNSGCPDNIIWDGDVPRFRNATEQKAYLERLQLDNMTKLNKLELARALEDLGNWKDVKTLIKSNEKFEDDWDHTEVINLEDDVFKQGFAMMSDIDMDTVKRKMLENNPPGII